MTKYWSHTQTDRRRASQHLREVAPGQRHAHAQHDDPQHRNDHRLGAGKALGPGIGEKREQQCPEGKQGRDASLHLPPLGASPAQAGTRTANCRIIQAMAPANRSSSMMPSPPVTF